MSPLYFNPNGDFMPNNPLINTQLSMPEPIQYVITVAFNELSMERKAYLDYRMDEIKRRAYDNLVARLRDEGYPDGTYSVNFAVTSDPGDGLISRLHASATVDARLKGTAYSMRYDEDEKKMVLISQLMKKGEILDNAAAVGLMRGPQPIAPQPILKEEIIMDETLKVKRGLIIKEV